MKERVFINLEEDMNKISQLYLSGLSAPKLSKLYNCSNPTIYKILKTKGIKRRDLHEWARCKTLDRSFFEKIDSHNKAQILGMIAADGNISNGSLQLRLAVQDLEYVKWVKSQLNYSRDIKIWKNKEKNRQDTAILKIGCKQLISDIQKLGIVPNKSLILKFPTEDQVPKQFINSYILGYFEGDGSLVLNYRNEACIDFCGTLQFCNELAKIFKTELNIHSTIYQAKHNQIHHLKIAGSHQVLRFLNWIYRDSTFRMQRKYNKYLIVKEKYAKIPPCQQIISFAENNGNSKLTIEKILEIKKLFKDGVSQRDIAEKFNVTQACISSIRKGKTWKCVNDLEYMKKYHKELYEKNLHI